jgi:N-acetylneuraminate lyase
MKPWRPLHHFVAATHSPFHADGSLAPDVVPVQAAFLARNGIRTVFVTGSTGECHALTSAERLSLYDAWAAAGQAHGLQVIAHVGGNALEDVRTWARHAQAVGLSAIGALAPSYDTPRTLADLIDWCAAVAAAAPDLPFYYYSFPAMTGVAFPMERFLVEAPPRIPTLAGVKFTNPDLVSYRRTLDVAGDRFDLPWGVDEALLAGLALGARGAVGSTYNFAPQLSVALREAFERGDLVEARLRQSQSIGLIDALAGIGYMGAAKALMTRLGVPVGPARLPHGNPTTAQVDELMVRLAAIGFGDWGPRGTP